MTQQGLLWDVGKHSDPKPGVKERMRMTGCVRSSSVPDEKDILSPQELTMVLYA